MTHWHAFLDMAVICLAFVAVCGLGSGAMWLADQARRRRDVTEAKDRTVPYDAVDGLDEADVLAAVERHRARALAIVPTEGCGCYTCDDARREQAYAVDGDFGAYLTRFMIVCPECGNKRCPKGTWHGNDCTGSNEPDQPGSRYAAYRDREGQR